MENILVRPLYATDYEQVVNLWRTSEGIGLSEADGFSAICRYLERNPQMSLVAEADGKIVGAVLCGHDGRRGYLHHLAVAAGFRSQGIGQRLVEDCLEHLISEKIDKCHIFVYPDNVRGLEFWRKIGFLGRMDILLCSRNL
jgi:putative acetyltransferase